MFFHTFLTTLVLAAIGAVCVGKIHYCDDCHAVKRIKWILTYLVVLAIEYLVWMMWAIQHT